MPRVSQAHLDARRNQILAAARRVFARRGFAGTSMQDLFRESGLSAGAVYRYFRSRDEIVQAIAASELAGVHDVLGAALAVDPPPPLEDVLADIARIIEANGGPEGVLRLTVQLWGQAPYVPGIAALANREYSALRGLVTELVRRAQSAGQLDPSADAAHVGVALFAVLPGFIVQRQLLGDVDAEQLRDGLRVLLAPQRSGRAALPGPAQDVGVDGGRPRT